VAESGIVHRVTVEFKSDKVAYDIDNWSWCKYYVASGEFPPGEAWDDLNTMLLGMKNRLYPGDRLTSNEPYVKKAIAGFLEMAHLVKSYDYNDPNAAKRKYSHYDDACELYVTIEVADTVT
jgi:hypothetical protein